MKTSDFSFDLPQELIAQYPSEERGASRLMVLDPQHHSIEHSMMAELARHVDPGTLLVVNNSRVRKARIFGSTEGGGSVEFLLTDRLADGDWLALLSRSSRQRVGRSYQFPDSVTGTIVSVEGASRRIHFSRPVDDAWLDRFGHVPLPPYIQREDTALDSERYQTVYAKTHGSAAAPTAGLHFTPEILETLAARGVEMVEVTLHVGLGTFLPIRTEKIEEHEMHTENFEISVNAAESVTKARADARPVVAVGTTTLRTLESAWSGNGLRAGTGSTNLYIYPGYRFRAVDALVTNFHTPGSSLLLLVAAFAGADFIRAAYEEAIRERYRFFSYGDAMFIRSVAR
ncbi:MAG TPA: tRNA preQ1(34) S-adenosylmethionine ribosyltransferase-isomerase QueA [Spirochaetia bacterium]|nr:tRNA preQ1(34) S-adenosylmethionine ribosyltransferase-isomerase QueA [Spirochaetia bacterium]